MKLSLYRMATILGGPLIDLYLRRRMARGREDRNRFPERHGQASMARPAGGLVWLHGASVGEGLSMLPLIERIRAGHSGLTVLVTTGTVTSAALMAERLPEGVIHQYVPVDRPAWVRRFLDHWRPGLALWFESELWPNLVLETAARSIPMVLVNGRMSTTSYEKWRRHPGAIRPLLARFRLCLGQTDVDAGRFHELGAPDTGSLGNLKFAVPPLPADEQAVNDMRGMIGDRPCWLAASTHAGEEAVAGRVHAELRRKHEDVLTVVVPRHPERGGVIAAELAQQGLRVARRSAGESLARDTDVYLADTLGELGLFYRLADAVFIGKSLARTGGQNPLEPARLGAPMVFGPHMENFAEIAGQLLEEGGARQIADEHQLASALVDLLADSAAAVEMGARAKAFSERQADVLDRIAERLSPMLRAAEVAR